MIRKLEAWLRRIFADEVNTGLVALEKRLCVEIRNDLATIEGKMTQQIAEAVTGTTDNLAGAVVRIQNNVDAEIAKMQNAVDRELNHCKATADQKAADELLRHPRHKR